MQIRGQRVRQRRRKSRRSAGSYPRIISFVPREISGFHLRASTASTVLLSLRFADACCVSCPVAGHERWVSLARGTRATDRTRKKRDGRSRTALPEYDRLSNDSTDHRTSLTLFLSRATVREEKKMKKKHLRSWTVRIKKILEKRSERLTCEKQFRVSHDNCWIRFDRSTDRSIMLKWRVCHGQYIEHEKKIVNFINRTGSLFIFKNWYIKFDGQLWCKINDLLERN